MQLVSPPPPISQAGNYRAASPPLPLLWQLARRKPDMAARKLGYSLACWQSGNGLGLDLKKQSDPMGPNYESLGWPSIRPQVKSGP